MAASLVGLELTETGALGKRTKYQEKNIAQFWVDLGTEAKKLMRSSLSSSLRLPS